MIDTNKKILAVIPARGGSKGLPGKNTKLLHGKPLICYSIDAARGILPDEHICVSTDDKDIIQIVEDYGLHVPFIRPDELATDQSSVNDVLLHALDFYKHTSIYYDIVLLLQPTSPLRTSQDIEEAFSLYDDSIDMVVSVSISHAPSVLCKENQSGFVELMLNPTAGRRQNVPVYYEYNGAIYIINPKSLREKGMSNFEKKVKYIMPKHRSIDIDDQYDFMYAETILAYER
ncbi:MAG: acylneuraminate cytidylyltransferase family protein [Tannerella sp.]|uniref:acylneuraminate cytidylyltransferase family protein n=1 Tax=Tannerella sp. TaxID=2382127 RepID=UPI003FA23CE8